MKNALKLLALSAIVILALSFVSCGECRHEQTRTIKKNETPPTCTEGGFYLEIILCDECETELSRTKKETLPTGHDEVSHGARASTCTEVGWYDYVTCNNCSYTTYVEIPASHSLITHNAKAPTCTEVGWAAYENCENCDYSTYSELPKSEHRTSPHPAKVPTCTEIGWEAYETCLDCPYTTYSELPMAKHDLVSHEPKNSSCTERGWAAYQSCKNCTYTTFKEIAARGHDYDGYTCLNCYNSLTPSEGLKYSLSRDGSYYIVSGRGDCTDEHVVIPLEYEGLPVKEIGSSAFEEIYEIYTLKSLTVLDNITKIGFAAFRSCKNLETVSIGRGVTVIEDDAFRDCTSLYAVYVNDVAAWCGIDFESRDSNPLSFAQHLYVGGNLLRELVVPNEVAVIKSYAFYGLTDLLSVTLHENITEIYPQAFEFCPKLVEVINHSALNVVSYSDTNGSVASYAPLVHNGDSKIVNVDGYLFITDHQELNWLIGYVGNETELVLPKDYIGEIYGIYKYAFYDNRSITSVTIPEGLYETVLEFAFAECKNLTSVNIGEGVKYIGREAFYGCSALERVILPKSLIRMDGYVFSDCPAISDVYYRGSESEFERVQYGDGGNSLASAEMHYNYIEE